MEKLTPSPQLIQQFEQVFIHVDSWESSVAKRVREFFPQDKIEKVFSSPFALFRGDQLSTEEFDRSKKIMSIQEYKGQFFKRCPGAKPGLACCNYFVLNLGLQCHMNCTYCYLQSFINTPALTVYSNIDQAIQELEVFAKEQAHAKIRIGTGETIDSLGLDDLTLYSRKLIEFFARVPYWKLELKTKSKKVEQFLDMPHKNNVIVSWSLNPQFIIEKEEPGTATLIERLKAARQCKDRGYLVAFHLDPLIWHTEWQTHYSSLIQTIAEYFSPNEVLNLSVGALRFQPEQRHMMRERFGSQSLINSAELFRSEDGKMRYDQRVRQEMFRFVIDQFKQHGEWNLFLCMETKESWLNAMNQMPKSFVGLEDYFDSRPTKALKDLREKNTASAFQSF